jgi:hypothetical protein
MKIEDECKESNNGQIVNGKSSIIQNFDTPH